MSRVENLEQLEAIYGHAAGAAVWKEIDHINNGYRAFIEASPFFALASNGPEGVDVSPRGDDPGFVRIADAKTLMIPDRRGNNRIDTLRNIAFDPRVSLLFLVPGHNEALRVLGSTRISVHPELLVRFEVDGKPPRSVLVISVSRVFFQCGRAALRSGLWESSRHVEKHAMPSAGSVLQVLTENEIDGAAYDAALPERQRSTLY